MNKIILSVYFIIFYCTSLIAQVSVNELLDKNSQFVVKVFAGTDGVVYREGFGLYAKNTGGILTPYNNIAGFKDIKFAGLDGDTLYAKGVNGIDRTADLVLLSNGEKKKEAIQLDYSSKLKINENIYIIGVNPNKIDTVYSGVVTDIYVNSDGITMYNYSAKMIPGIEGGLVFNEKMKLVGLTKGLYRNNYFSGFVIPLQYAKPLIENSKKKMIQFTDSLLNSGYNVAYWRGIYSAEKGVNEYQEAIYHFKIALQEKPKDLNAYFQLGLTFGLKNLLDSAIYYYKEAVSIDPKFVYGQINLSVAYIMKDDYGNAVKTLKEAVKYNSTYARLHFYLAYSLMKSSQYAESIKYFKKSVELEPNDPSVLEQFSEAYYLNKKYRDALKTANHALKLNPKASNAIYVIGVTNLELGDKNEAMRAQQALDGLDKMKANALLEKINSK